jgi:hypothetical protein
MKSSIPVRSLLAVLVFSACSVSWAATGLVQVGGATRHEVRQAVQAHRAAQREELQREEASAGRRLTPAELAELRSQVRQQWSPRYDAPHVSMPSPAAEASQTAEPQPPTPMRVLTLPRSQRQ